MKDRSFRLEALRVRSHQKAQAEARSPVAPPVVVASATDIVVA